MSPTEPARSLPILHYSTVGKPREEAFETWRQLMRMTYGIEPAARNADGQAPAGGITAYRLGTLLANRTVWQAQHVARDHRLADASPDHIAFQLCRRGSYRGDISGQTATLLPGTVAIANRRRMLAGTLAADTMGLVVPRHFFAGVDTDALAVRLDRDRNQLLSARVDRLYRSLPQVQPSQAPALEAELVAFLRRLLDPSRARDVLEGQELDVGQFARAERFIQSRLGDPDLTPERIATALGLSRTALYRVFAPVGGVRSYVQDQRFRALRDALADPLEPHSVARLGELHGIRSATHLSQGFRMRFGLSARGWREQCRANAEAKHREALDRTRVWMHEGRTVG